MDMMSYSKKYSRLLLWGIFSFLVLTGNLLSVIGYSSLINISPVFKLGIGVILLFFCFFIYVHKMTIPNPEKHIFIVIAIMLYVNMIIKGEYQITNYISAIVFPVCLSCLFSLFQNKRMQMEVRYIVMIFFYLECFIAIVEKIMMFHFFGNMENEDAFVGRIDSYEFRSCGLWGHPLSNSCILSLMMPFILLQNEFSIKKKNLLWSIGMLALLCFNSRFSIVLSAVVYILLNYKNMIYSRHRIKYVLYIGLTSAVFLYMLFNTSFGGRLLDLGLYGDASSMARTEILDIFQVVDYREFMFVGIPYEDIIYIQAMAGLDYLIIENPWIIFIFRYGILQTFAMILFFIPLFHKWLIPYGKFNAWVICILFLSLVSSSNSLAVGSTAIAQVYLFAFAFKNQKNKYDSKDNTLLLAE